MWSLGKLSSSDNQIARPPNSGLLLLKKFIQSAGTYRVGLEASVDGAKMTEQLYLDVRLPDLKVGIVGGQQRQHQRGKRVVGCG